MKKQRIYVATLLGFSIFYANNSEARTLENPITLQTSRDGQKDGEPQPNPPPGVCAGDLSTESLGSLSFAINTPKKYCVCWRQYYLNEDGTEPPDRGEEAPAGIENPDPIRRTVKVDYDIIGVNNKEECLETADWDGERYNGCTWKSVYVPPNGLKDENDTSWLPPGDWHKLSKKDIREWLEAQRAAIKIGWQNSVCGPRLCLTESQCCHLKTFDEEPIVMNFDYKTKIGNQTKQFSGVLYTLAMKGNCKCENEQWVPPTY